LGKFKDELSERRDKCGLRRCAALRGGGDEEEGGGEEELEGRSVGWGLGKMLRLCEIADKERLEFTGLLAGFVFDFFSAEERLSPR
jgi:hypothetical protein